MSTKLTALVWGKSIGKSKAKLVLLRLSHQANDAGLCHLSMERVARDCETGKGPVVRAFQWLELQGFIEVVTRGQGRRTSTYRVFPKEIR